MDWKNKLFESYNKALASSYDLYVRKKGKSAAEGLEDGAYEACREAAESQWNGSPLDFAGGKSPVEVISELNTLPDTMELFKAACMVCDDGIPSILADKLKSFGTAAEEQLIELACSKPESEEDEAFMVSIVSIRLLGQWKVVRMAPELTRLLLSCGPDDYMLLEEIELALVSMEDTQIMLQEMKAAEKWSHPHDYLASALAKAGRNSRNDFIYRCLKEYFQKSGKIVLGASNLAEYGDSRAIPALRGYAERKMAALGPEEFYEIKSAVEVLGGDMEDLAVIYARTSKWR